MHGADSKRNGMDFFFVQGPENYKLFLYSVTMNGKIYFITFSKKSHVLTFDSVYIHNSLLSMYPMEIGNSVDSEAQNRDGVPGCRQNSP